MEALAIGPIALAAPSEARAAVLLGRTPSVESGAFQRADDTGPHRHSLQRLAHVRNARVRAGALPAASADVGDVAVLVSNDSIVVPPRIENRLDLPTPSSLSVVPGASGPDESSVAFSAVVFDPNLGPEVAFQEFGPTQPSCPSSTAASGSRSWAARWTRLVEKTARPWRSSCWSRMARPAPRHTRPRSGSSTPLRRTWERYGNGPATAGRGKLDTGLDPECF